MNRIKLLAVMLIFPWAAGCNSAKDIQPQTIKKQIINVQLSSKDISTKDSIQMTKTPTTPIELLENLKVALDNGLLLREDFYTDENLKLFTGGSNLKVLSTGKIGANYIDIEITGFDQIPRYKPYNPASPNEISLWVSVNKKEDGKLLAAINTRFELNDDRVSYTKLEPLFGAKWEQKKQPLWGTNRLYRAPTEAHGNERLGYIIKHPNLTEEHLTIDFGPSAIAENINFRLEQK